MSSPTFGSGSAIGSLQNSAQFSQTVNLNMCGGAGCSPSPSTGEIWINGQFEGDDYALEACSFSGCVYGGENAYVSGIVNIPVSNGNIQAGWDYNAPPYTSDPAFGQDFHQVQIGGIYAGTGSGTPQQQITSYGVTADYLGNQIQWYADMAFTGLSFVPFAPAQELGSIGGLMEQLVGPIGSTNTNQYTSWF